MINVKGYKVEVLALRLVILVVPTTVAVVLAWAFTGAEVLVNWLDSRLPDPHSSPDK